MPQPLQATGENQIGCEGLSGVRQNRERRNRNKPSGAKPHPAHLRRGRTVKIYLLRAAKATVHRRIIQLRAAQAAGNRDGPA